MIVSLETKIAVISSEGKNLNSSEKAWKAITS